MKKKVGPIWVIRHVWRDSKDQRHEKTVAIGYTEKIAEICKTALEVWKVYNKAES
jgi:hypothetical protein